MICKFDPAPMSTPTYKKPRYNRVKTDHLCLLLLCTTCIFKVKITFFFFDNSHKFFYSMNHVAHEAYSEPCQISQTKLFAKKANTLNIFSKTPS